jgi:uroporphyrinogen III methyltransferase / synthase
MTDSPYIARNTAYGAPLSGRFVVVTRARAQAAGLIEPLEALGARVLLSPAIETVEPEDWGPADAAIDDIEGYNWIVLTSTNGVERFLARVRERRGSLKVLEQSKIAAVGSATAESLQAEGIEPDLVPEEFHAESLTDALVEMGAGPGWRVLLARAVKGRDVLPEQLLARGVEIDVVPVYRTVGVEADPEVIQLLRYGRLDAVTFTSPSTAEHFIAEVIRAGMEPRVAFGGVIIASIGPVTTEALRRFGLEPDVEPAESTMPALAAALGELFSA